MIVVRLLCHLLQWSVLNVSSSTTHETHEAPFRPVPVYIHALQKHRRRNTHSCIHTHLEKPGSFVRISSSAFLLPSIPYNHTSWQANVWNSSLTQDWFSGLSTFLSIILRQFVTKLYWLSTRHCPISYSFHARYKWLHRHWHNTKHKILWRFCNGRSLLLRFCLFWWSWKVQ